MHMASSSSGRKSSKAKNDQPYEWSWHLIDESSLPEPFNQGPAGSCAIIAGSKACAAAFKIQYDVLLRLAYQQIVNEMKQVYPDQARQEDAYHVPVAHTSLTLKFIKQYGIGMADELPYRACRTDEKLPKNSARLKIGDFVIYSTRYMRHYGDQNYHTVSDMGGEEIEKLIRQRPIVGEFDTDRFYNYPETWENEIYRRKEPAKAAHSILVTGYGHGERRENPFYWCQDSYGPNNGPYGGYKRITRYAFYTFYNVIDPYLETPDIRV